MCTPVRVHMCWSGEVCSLGNKVKQGATAEFSLEVEFSLGFPM